MKSQKMCKYTKKEKIRYPFNEASFVEAWKNAILHNDYSSKEYLQMVSHIQKFV